MARKSRPVTLGMDQIQAKVTVFNNGDVAVHIFLIHDNLNMGATYRSENPGVKSEEFLTDFPVNQGYLAAPHTPYVTKMVSEMIAYSLKMGDKSEAQRTQGAHGGVYLNA